LAVTPMSQVGWARGCMLVVAVAEGVLPRALRDPELEAVTPSANRKPGVRRHGRPEAAAAVAGWLGAQLRAGSPKPPSVAQRWFTHYLLPSFLDFAYLSRCWPAGDSNSGSWVQRPTPYPLGHLVTCLLHRH
jgi:hypothetical protein